MYFHAVLWLVGLSGRQDYCKTSHFTFDLYGCWFCWFYSRGFGPHLGDVFESGAHVKKNFLEDLQFSQKSESF